MTDDYYVKLRDMRNKENKFAYKNGIVITEIKKGYAVVEMDVTDDDINPFGTVHGGCLFTIADVTGGAAASSYGHVVTTAEADMHYLRPGRNVTHLRGVNREIKHGKNLIVNEVMITDQNGTELAFGVFTYAQLDQEITL